MDLLSLIQQQFSTAIQTLTPQAADYAHMVRPTQDPKHGDYQANAAMPLKKELGGNPREIAQKIVDALPNKDRFSSIDIAGPGFINVRLSDAFLADGIREVLADQRMGIPLPMTPPTMVIDYSSPNVAKPMHVGHLRSTVIGDAICRIHRALGWNVISDNHLGDWGTQFGMLIYGWRHHRDDTQAKENPIGELARLYKLVNNLAEKDPEIANAARRETAKLHSGDLENLKLWKEFMPHCLADLKKIYDRLGIAFDYQLGESFYHPMLAEVVEELNQCYLAESSQGAQCVFFPHPDGKCDEHGKPMHALPPFMIQKQDGAFTYATSDLACIKYRVSEFQPNVIVYVVDDRQSLHFEQLFETARRWKYSNVRLVHVAFGKILGKDNRPFKTREGRTFGLADLLDEAVEHARKTVDEIQDREPVDEQMSASERASVALAVGHGAVKYADLSQNRASDYVFDIDKMVSLVGNTAPYLMYAYARNRSIFSKSGVDAATLRTNPPTIVLEHPSERALALKLLQYPEALASAALDFRPNLLANYLFELSETYSGFFRDCPVIKAPIEELRNSRLGLCQQTAQTMRHGLNLLGIETVERM